MEVIYPDAEEAAQEWLDVAMDSRWPGCNVSMSLPQDWKRGSAPHVMVQCDGTPSAVPPIEAYSTVRVTAFHHNRSDAKALCAAAHAALLAHPLGDGIGRVEWLTGVQPAKDESTGAHIASATVRMTVRSQAPSGPPSGS